MSQEDAAQGGDEMIELLRRFIWAITPCRHIDPNGDSLMYREKRGGVLHLICPRCDRAVPALRRTADERAALKVIPPAHETLRVHRPRAARLVATLGRKGRL